jgi:ankyrin repeat protein
MHLNYTSANQMTPLMLAVAHNNLEVTKDIMELGKSDMYALCSKYQNVLHYAVLTHNKDMIKYIVSCDAENNMLRKELNVRGLKPFDSDVK